MSTKTDQLPNMVNPSNLEMTNRGSYKDYISSYIGWVSKEYHIPDYSTLHHSEMSQGLGVIHSWVLRMIPEDNEVANGLEEVYDPALVSEYLFDNLPEDMTKAYSKHFKETFISEESPIGNYGIQSYTISNIGDVHFSLTIMEMDSCIYVTLTDIGI